MSLEFHEPEVRVNVQTGSSFIRCFRTIRLQVAFSCLARLLRLSQSSCSKMREARDIHVGLDGSFRSRLCDNQDVEGTPAVYLGVVVAVARVWRCESAPGIGHSYTPWPAAWTSQVPEACPSGAR